MQVIGIVQEQHAERTKLYKQWKRYEWPIVQDALNLLEVKVVPLLIAVNEEGVVCSHQASAEFIKKWMDQEVVIAGEEDTIDMARPFTDAREAFLWGGELRLDDSIAAYDALLTGDEAKNPAGHFEIAVGYRNRFERDGNPEDFQKAIDHWSTALALDPNQYIYRRRIEQYGARLGKPYPFYDWVETAQKEIRERGETPVELKVAISGAEIASPIRKFESIESNVDWESANKIAADDADLVQATAVAVPAVIQPGKATRVHVLVSPGSNAKWNNEAGPTSFVLDSTSGGTCSKRSFEFPLPDQAESSETRRFEFEVLIDKDAGDSVKIRGAVLMRVCISDSGTCTYLRKPFEIEIEVRDN